MVKVTEISPLGDDPASDSGSQPFSWFESSTDSGNAETEPQNEPAKNSKKTSSTTSEDEPEVIVTKLPFSGFIGNDMPMEISGTLELKHHGAFSSNISRGEINPLDRLDVSRFIVRNSHLIRPNVASEARRLSDLYDRSLPSNENNNGTHNSPHVRHAITTYNSTQH